MDAFAACHHWKRLKAHRFQDIAELKRRFAKGLEIQSLVGIEIEDEPIRLFDILDAAPQPWNSIVPI
jgi:hypothetical protein